jgi:hypothetical protein
LPRLSHRRRAWQLLQEKRLDTGTVPNYTGFAGHVAI